MIPQSPVDILGWLVIIPTNQCRIAEQGYIFAGEQ